ncbi:MAG: DNA recombination protein RmuC [candidate division WS2 bacterium ADurb.Bin280]|uniref:DNA recombination protein RmuC n=1 Tax=candidate division WS2 bacterium ADurb.Bin280 TaxID=1852829 RepID=A0A1V5SG03_9BACT|nr:MAG: DNA recombination protein RmuC [candidate division WS2 bacterium ADurb.Bin280]
MDNTIIYIAITSFVAAIAGILLSNFFVKRAQKNGSIDDELLENKISRISSEALDKNSQRFLLMAKEILNSQKTEIKTDLEGKKSAINELIAEIRRDIRKNEERLSRSDEERVRSFTALQNELESYKKITGELKISADKLKNLLANNQWRGAFGEQIAENLLKMAGFVIGTDYTRNEKQTTENTRPDFTIFLPDQTKINVDVKFPYASLVRTIESENADEKKKHFQTFKQDVKNKIKQVCTREYINPSEKTVDFVILFIPNEMIFSYIYDSMNDVWEEAMRKKVVLAGPFSFTAILRMIKQAYSNFRYQENLQHIITLIQKFDNEYEKFSQEFDKLGERINSTSRQYESVATTRNRQLTSVVDKIKSQNISDSSSIEDIKELA